MMIIMIIIGFVPFFLRCLFLCVHIKCVNMCVLNKTKSNEKKYAFQSFTNCKCDFFFKEGNSNCLKRDRAFTITHIVFVSLLLLFFFIIVLCVHILVLIKTKNALLLKENYNIKYLLYLFYCLKYVTILQKEND